MKGSKEVIYLTMNSTHFYSGLYGVGHMVKDHTDNKKTHCHHFMGNTFQLAARNLLQAPSHRQDSIYHVFLLCQSWSIGWNMK